MLDIAVIIILVIVAFAGVAWYGNRSSQQRTKLLEEIDDIEPELGDSDKFGALFDQELQHQSIENDHFEIDAEPKITLSESVKSIATAPAKETQINITLDDDLDDAEQAIEQQAAEPQEDIELDDVPEEPAVINGWDMVISFTVMARDDQLFSGKSIKSTLESLDLHFGDLQIFHRTLPGLRKQTLFSVANILDPGTLNPDGFATMRTPGLLVFARLPGPVNGLTLFDDLLDVAQKMTDKLDGTLCDESREVLSQSAIEDMRNRILNLNLQLQAEQSNYNNDYSD
ncbi:MAG: cell division protein ZipA [Methylophaga sp.]|nr:cell division protein ZipA [Methylophaga sp.]